MVVCKFFAKGFCKFGDRCRYEHVRQSQGGSKNQYRSQRDDYNSYQSNRSYVKPSQFQSDQQDRYSSPFSRNNQGSDYQHKEKNDRYHWTPTSNRFAPLSEPKGYFGTSGGGGGGGGSEDDAIIKSIQNEMSTWLSSNMWPYSCFSDGKSNMVFIEGLADIQPEELRTLFYLHGPASYKEIMREVDNMYSTRKQELLQMSSEVRSSVLNNFHMSAELNPSSCLTIYSMYGPGADFKPVSNEEPPPIVLPSQTQVPFEAFKPQAPSSLSFEQAKPLQVATATEPSPQPAKTFSLFKPVSVSTDSGTVDDIYTDENILTEPELKEFKAESFTLGKIPMRPPPKSLCR